VVPFSSSYQRFWLGIGAISLDLMIAMIVTSLLRPYLGRMSWRAVHWLAYVLWPARCCRTAPAGFLSEAARSPGPGGTQHDHQLLGA
jgi:methionine sulfoxide reductase heme-binding subunit